MQRDLFDNPLSTTSPVTKAAIDGFVESYIGFGTDFVPIFDASDKDPDCLMAAAYGCLLGLFMETPNRLEIAGRYYQRMIAAMGGGDNRERQFAAAVMAMHDKDISGALKNLKSLATEYPGDLFAAKLGQNLFFNTGNDEGMLWLADQVIERHRTCAYAYGMRAFGREQMSMLDLAEEDGRRATEMQRKEPWAHHAVAHVMLTQGRHDEGIKWMSDLSNEWDDRNSFMLTHNWWHLALFYLEQEDFETPLELYDMKVWGVDKSYSLDQVNAISLLWRLEQLGVDVGNRWQDLGDRVAARSFINDQPFYDMHYAYVLARAGKKDALDALMTGIKKMASEAPELTRGGWAEVALSACRGFIAIAAGDYKGAVEHLRHVQPRLQEIGGSHAQRDLFELAWLTSLIKAGDVGAVLPRLEKRLKFRPHIPMEKSLMALVAS
ncbi:MAG: tetratricopeptide repeat protein 38 family protein [Sneathiella sp.]|nr:MAG: tetratricopeptide repeat protein 38 family protein [Sneathiella sp.]